jgi:hypothetical protein
VKAPTKTVALVILLSVAVPVFVLFAPVMYLPYSNHTICTNFGAYCQQVAQCGSLSDFYLCTGAIYQTDGSYWIGTCMYG